MGARLASNHTGNHKGLIKFVLSQGKRTTNLKPMIVPLPDRVKTALRKYFPETGEDWIDAYPRYLTSLLDRWQLTIEAEAPPGWPTNLVLFVRNLRGERLVVKLGHPNPESDSEQAYLDAQKDRPVVELLGSAPGYAMLMPRIMPGTSLRREIMNHDAIAAALALHLHLPSLSHDERFPRFADWLERAFAEYARNGRDQQFIKFTQRARELFIQISAASENEMLLHGDLHHDNILKSESGWIAIDPKGVRGPALMECGRFFHNFMADEVGAELEPQAVRLALQSRFDLGSRVLPYSTPELMAATFVDLTLSVCWQLNSDEPSPNGMLMLNVLNELLDSR